MTATICSSDLIETQTWRSEQRAMGYLVDSFVFRNKRLPEFAVTTGERFWLLLYAPASFFYRIMVLLAIALFIASEYLAVGVAVAIWGLFTGIALPVGKALGRYLCAAPAALPGRDCDKRFHSGHVDRFVLDSGPSLYDDGKGLYGFPKAQCARQNERICAQASSRARARCDGRPGTCRK